MAGQRRPAGGHAQPGTPACTCRTEARIGRSLLLTGGLRHDNARLCLAGGATRLRRVDPGARMGAQGRRGQRLQAPNLKQVSPAYREDEGPSTYLGQAGLRRRAEPQPGGRPGLGPLTPGPA